MAWHLRYQYVGQKIILNVGEHTYPLDLMPTMKNKHNFQRTNAHYQSRLKTEMADCLALKKALKFSGINAIDIPCIELIDIFSSLHDPVMRLQALVALEEGRFNIQPCIKMSF